MKLKLIHVTDRKYLIILIRLNNMNEILLHYRKNIQIEAPHFLNFEELKFIGKKFASGLY